MAPLSEEDALLVAERCLGGGVEAVTVDAGPYEEQVTGFLGDHLKLVLTVLPSQRRLHFFGKTVPRRLDCHAAFTRELRCFDKELEFYERALPRLEAALGGGGCEPWAPRCFLARPDVLVLEDLAAEGFRSPGCRRPLDGGRCEAALGAMARLHAASVLLERREGVALGELFPVAGKNFITYDVQHQPMVTGWVQAGMASLVAVAEMAGVPEDAVRSRLSAMLETLRGTKTPSSTGLNVLCHGDGWVNNMLFRGDSEARLVDFQMCRYSPPAFDVAVLLHMSLPRRLRLVPLAALLRHYYASLGRSLRRHQVDVAQVLPWRDFCSSYRTFRDPALLLAALNHSLSLMPGEVLKGVMHVEGQDGFTVFMTRDRSEAARRSFQQDSAFAEWVGDDLRDVVDDFVLPDIEQPTIE